MTKLRGAMLHGTSKGALTVVGAHRIIANARRNIAEYAQTEGVPLREEIANPGVVVVKKAQSAGQTAEVLAGFERNGSPILLDMRSSDS